MTSTISHLAALEHVADMHRAAERHRQVAAATKRRERSLQLPSLSISFGGLRRRTKTA